MRAAIRSSVRFTLTSCLCAALAGLLTGCGKRNGHASHAATVDEIGFSIQPPDGWQGRPTKSPTELNYYSQKDVKHCENLNVTISADDGTPIEDYPDSFARTYAKRLANWKKLEDGFETIGNHKVYRYVLRVEQGMFQMIFVQYVLRWREEQNIIVTYAIFESHYDELKAAIDKSAKSIKTD